MSALFSGVGRQAVPATPREWVRPVSADGRLPLEVRPAADVDLAHWAREHVALVDEWLHRHGAVMFAGFGVNMTTFAAVAESLVGPPLPYRERSSPRTELAPGVFTSTDYPADQAIPLHNENSYQATFPARLVFCCIDPPAEGGATPVADCRRVLARLDPAIRARFVDSGVRYVRNYSTGLGLPWRDAFQQTTRDAVDEYCRTNGIIAHWRDDDGLRTEQVRSAVVTHPRTGDAVWFNHAAFFHPTSLPGELHDALVAQYGEYGLPTNTTYGDGAPIEPETLAAVRAAYAAEQGFIPWRAGDVLLVDNLLSAHGREPYAGSRRVVVSMGGLITRDNLTPYRGP